MIDLPDSMVIAAAEAPMFFAFDSPDLAGSTGVDHSVEDCLDQARWGMREHVEILREEGLPVPSENPDPVVTLRNDARRTVA